jgi:hypothetical protein
LLKTLNLLSNSFSSLIILSVLKEINFFNLLQDNQDLNALKSKIIKQKKFNSGYFYASLEVLEILKIIEIKENKVKILENDFVKKFIPDNLNTFYNKIKNKKFDKIFFNLLKKYQENPFNKNSNLYSIEFLNGFWLLPILYELKRSKLISMNNYEVIIDHKISSIHLFKLFSNLGFVKSEAANSAKKYYLNSAGKYLFDKLINTGVNFSYLKTLANLKKIFFSKPKEVFSVNKKGIEMHIDRNLNVISSAAQHGKYFDKMKNLVLNKMIDLLKTEENNLIGLVDTGCGDSSFGKVIFKEISEVISEKKLKRIIIIGVDLNQEALKQSKINLGIIPNYLFKGNIADPKKIINKIYKKYGKNINLIHIRSFLDHNRTFSYKKLKKSNVIDLKLKTESWGIDNKGEYISFNKIINNLNDMMNKWSSILQNKNNFLILAEVHRISKDKIYENLHLTEDLAFNITQKLSQQYLIEPFYFQLVMAENGLFSIENFFSYPSGFDFKRITCGEYVSKRFYIVMLNQKKIKNLEKKNIITNVDKGFDYFILQDRKKQKNQKYLIAQVKRETLDENINIDKFFSSDIQYKNDNIDFITSFIQHIYKLKKYL